MFGAVNVGVLRPRPSLPWQLAQVTCIMPPPVPAPIIPAPVEVALRGMTAPLTSRPVSKITSPRETAEPVPEAATYCRRCSASSRR